MRFRSTLLVPLILGMLQGCANLGSIYRPIAVEGKAVAIDGYQTPVFSSIVNLAQDRTDATETNIPRTVICPSPPVDAIAAHSFSTGLTNNFTSETAKNNTQFTLADVMAAVSIGLRTNSTTLLSYNSAWNCLAYMGGATTDPKFMELARRNQNNTLGVLAIEQLTGVTKAAQGTIGGTAAGGTGTEDITAYMKSIDDARKSQNDARALVDQKSLALKEEETKLVTLQKTLEAKEKTQTALPAAATAEQKEEAELAVATATAERDAGRKAVESARLEVSAARREIDRTTLSVRAAEDALTLAQMRVKATASATASLTESGGPQAAATTAIADAVTSIVQAVLFESGRGESCNTVFEDVIKTPTKYNEGSASKLLDFCITEREQDNAAQREVLRNMPRSSAPK